MKQALRGLFCFHYLCGVKQFLFIKTATDSVAIPASALLRTEYTSDTTVSLFFGTTKDGKGATTAVVLSVTSGKANDVVNRIIGTVSSGSKSVLVYDDVNNKFSVSGVTGISSIATTADPSSTAGATGPTGPTGPTGSTGSTGPAGPTYGAISCGFFDDIGTSIHYLPLNGAPTEQPSDANSYTDWVCPCNIVVKSVQLRGSSFTSSGNLTLTVEKDPIGSGADTDVESETVAVTGSDDQDVVHFLFDNAPVSVGERLKIKIQADADLSGNQNWFAVVVYEADWDTRYTQSSGIITS